MKILDWPGVIMQISERRTVDVKQDDYDKLAYHYYRYIQPLIRPSQPGDSFLYVGKSPVSEKLCLFSEPKNASWNEDDSKYSTSAAEAYFAIEKIIQTGAMHVDGKPVFELGYDFHDVNGRRYYELSFPSLLAVSMLQQFFDDNSLQLMLVPLEYKWAYEWTRTESDEEVRRLFDFFYNYRGTGGSTETEQSAACRFYGALPPITPWDFPDDKTVDKLYRYELIGLNKWIKGIDGIQQARVFFGLSVNPGGLSGILRAPRFFFIRWILNGVELEFAAGKPFPTVSNVFSEFMKIALSPGSIDTYKPVRPFPLYISSGDLSTPMRYIYKSP